MVGLLHDGQGAVRFHIGRPALGRNLAPIGGGGYTGGVMCGARVSETVTVDSLRRQARGLFPASATALLDAECILGFVLGATRTELLAHGERSLSPREQAAFFVAAKKRQAGLPVAYITGVKEFFGLDFLVTPDTLIPKSDTEILVERTLEAIAGLAEKVPPDRPLQVCDVCTGSGCVGLSVLAHSPALLVLTLTDVSGPALAVARQNAARLFPAGRTGTHKALRFVQADLLDFPLPPRFDVIAANPPYIPDDQAAALLRDGRGEPRLALAGGKTGFEITRRLIAQAARCLAPGGRLLFEIDEAMAPVAEQTLGLQGFTGIRVFPDLAGKPRVVEARM